MAPRTYESNRLPQFALRVDREQHLKLRNQLGAARAETSSSPPASRLKAIRFRVSLLVTRLSQILTGSKPTALSRRPAPVAVRAAHLALIQLIDQGLGATAASHQRRYLFCLRLDVVELEYKNVCNATVDTGRVAQTVPEDPDIAAVCRGSWTCKFHVATPGKTKLVVDKPPRRRMALVTVRAQHLAFGDLQPDPADGDPKVDHVANVAGLCRRVQVIELQDDGIALTALHTRMLKQKLQDKLAIRIALHRIVPLVPLEIRSLVILIMLLRRATVASTAP